MALVAPSLLACNFLKLHDECILVNNSLAHWFHLDVMDGRFVPNISFGLPIIEQIKKVATKPLDVHLMMVEPEKYIADFCKAGADVLTIHLEASTHLHRSLQHIKQLGMKAGVALNPHTPICLLEDIITDADVVCLMSVNPGFGGQRFIANTIKKIEQLRALITAKNATTLIEIDGGVTLDNAQQIITAGADVLVAGNTVFAAEKPMEVIAKLATIK